MKEVSRREQRCSQQQQSSQETPAFGTATRAVQAVVTVTLAAGGKCPVSLMLETTLCVTAQRWAQLKQGCVGG